MYRLLFPMMFGGSVYYWMLPFSVWLLKGGNHEVMET